MTKKVLMLAAKANMVHQFNQRNIKILQELGYEVHVATNMVDAGSMSAQENERFKQWMIDNDVIAHQVNFERRLGTVKGNIIAVRQLKKLFRDNDYKFIHVHSPLGSILGRYVARRFKVPSIYTAHGFHFFKGGPKSGWLIFFPIEWFFSFFTDTLVTINDEDFAIATKYMHAKSITKINGIGVDVIKSWNTPLDYKKSAQKRIRQELEIPDGSILISSVGELNNNKNHKIVLKALGLMSSEERKKFYYVIAGTGKNAQNLTDIAKSIGFAKHFQLLGYRNDIHDINYASDISVFPSLREGLGIAGLDATVDGTYLIATNRGGVSNYLKNGVNGKSFNPENAVELKDLLLANANHKTFDKKFDFLKKFDIKTVDETMKRVYKQWEEK